MKISRRTCTRLQCFILVAILVKSFALETKSSKVQSHLDHDSLGKLTLRKAKTPHDLNTVAPTHQAASMLPKASSARGLRASVATKAPRPEGKIMAEARTSSFAAHPCTNCIVIICFQFAVVYMALALCRTYHEITGTAKGQLEAALRAAAQTLTYGPMVCVLFLACRMHIKTEHQAWVQVWMFTLTFSVFMSTLLVLLVRLVSDEPLQLKGHRLEIERQFRGSAMGEPYWGWDRPLEEACSDGYRIAFYALTSIRYLILCTLFVGLGGVIYEIYTYSTRAPRDLSSESAPSTAVMCTTILAVAFFSTQLVIAVCCSISEFTRVNFPQVVGMMHASAAIVDFAPMLAVLFLIAHMRALRHGATLDDWVHSCMAAATGAMCVAALLAILVPLQLGATLKMNRLTSDLLFQVPKSTFGLGYIFIAMRYACMIIFYGAASGVIRAIFVFESPGPMATLPVSLEEQCVVNLTCQFFLVYFIVTLVLTASEITGGTNPIERWSLFPAIEAARWAVAFAPMLSIIFITAESMPQAIEEETVMPAWMQNGMCLATWALQMCCLSCLATDLFMAKAETDDAGRPINKFRNWHIGIIVIFVRYLTMLVMYRGAAAVIFGILSGNFDYASAS